VQRDNAEMERRCQEVIDRCWALGPDNPISFIHDVGAGGVSNALPELVNDGGRGGRFNLRALPNDEPGMSPLEIWCNESQERYVLAVPAARIGEFRAAVRARALPVRRRRRGDGASAAGRRGPAIQEHPDRPAARSAPGQTAADAPTDATAFGRSIRSTCDAGARVRHAGRRGAAALAEAVRRVLSTRPSRTKRS
jgi:hypothetical protein